jgi:hypothetical protein
MTRLENDPRDTHLTPEAIAKADKDIATIRSLDKFAKETGNILVLSGGYAVEAHCGGAISRNHGDIDAHLILTGIKSTEELFFGVEELLNKEDTKWELRDKKPDKFDFLEDVKTDDFFQKRRVEVRLNHPHAANVNYPIRKLIDSQSREVEVHVVDLSQIVSEKLSKFYSLKDGVDTSTDRHSSASDHLDLERLLNLEELDLEEIKNKMPEEYKFSTSLLARYFINSN